MNVYFPGDPPLVEVALRWFGLCLVLLGVPVVATLVYRRLHRKAIGKILPSLLLLPATPFLVCLVLLSARQFGEWSRLNAALRMQSARVLHEAGGAPRQLSEAEYFRIKQTLFTPPPELRFSGLRAPVRIRIMQATRPYVGADFEGGANAVFDLSTMYCTYSD